VKSFVWDPRPRVSGAVQMLGGEVLAVLSEIFDTDVEINTL